MTAVLFDPAAAIAAGHCLTARSIDEKRRTTRAHPRRCAWCEYSAAELRQMVDGHNAWSGYRESTRTYERHDARVFAELPRERQQELVVEAQGFAFVDEPVASVPTTPEADLLEEAAARAEPEPVEPSSGPGADGQANQEDVVAWL
jgi:hypothetical protein